MIGLWRESDRLCLCSDTIYTLDPWTRRWTEQPRMAHGRWYPTQTLLPDGRTMTVLTRPGEAPNPWAGARDAWR